jgi:hypothetical protein
LKLLPNDLPLLIFILSIINTLACQRKSYHARWRIIKGISYTTSEDISLILREMFTLKATEQ